MLAGGRGALYGTTNKSTNSLTGVAEAIVPLVRFQPHHLSTQRPRVIPGLCVIPVRLHPRNPLLPASFRLRQTRARSSGLFGPKTNVSTGVWCLDLHQIGELRHAETVIVRARQRTSHGGRLSAISPPNSPFTLSKGGRPRFTLLQRDSVSSLITRR